MFVFFFTSRLSYKAPKQGTSKFWYTNKYTSTRISMFMYYLFIQLQRDNLHRSKEIF